MTEEDTRERVPMYMAISDASGAERHISLVPHMPGLEAICGQAVRITRPGPWRAVVIATTCPVCRARGIDAARPTLARALPRRPASA